MRVTYAVQGLLAASATMAASYNPQHVVLGTDGTIVDADPSLYFRPSKTQLHHDLHESKHQVPHLVALDSKLQDTTEAEAEADDLPVINLPSIHELLPINDFESSVQGTEEDEFSSSSTLEDTISPISKSRLAGVEDSSIPGVYGSVMFAELSCCFVAFIGYLVRSIPLWVGFSRGQKCCLIVAFSLAFLYQFAVVGWYSGAVSPELMLGMSSLITRMISLGMVPITTTSFMGRAREICLDHTVAAPSESRKSSHSSRNSRRHHARARSN